MNLQFTKIARQLLIILIFTANISLVLANNSITQSIGTTGRIIQTTISETIKLSTSGTQILDGNGVPYQIIGMNIGTNERLKKDGTGSSITNTPKTDPYEAWFSPDDVDFIKSLGYNTIEIHMIAIQKVSNQDGSINEQYFIDFIDEWVRWITEKELYVIINYQRFNPTDGSFERYGWYYVPEWFYTDYGKPTTYDEVAEICLDFYDISVTHMNDEREKFYDIMVFTANRYKDNPYVMISPRNEPLHFVYKYVQNEAHALRVGNGYTAVITEAVDRMRATGYDGLIFVDKNYATALYGWEKGNSKIERENIVWEGHKYISRHHTPDQWVEKVDEFIAFSSANNQPLHIGEWGLEPQSLKDTYGIEVHNMMIDYLDLKGISSSYTSYSKIWGYANWKANGDGQFSMSEVELMTIIMKR